MRLIQLVGGSLDGTHLDVTDEVFNRREVLMNEPITMAEVPKEGDPSVAPANVRVLRYAPNSLRDLAKGLWRLQR